MLDHTVFPLKPSSAMLDNMEKIKKSNPPNFHLHLRIMKLLGSFDPRNIEISVPPSALPKIFELPREPSTAEEIMGGEFRENASSCFSRPQIRDLWWKGRFETRSSLSEVRSFRCSSCLFPGLKKINKEYCDNIAYTIDLYLISKDLVHNDVGKVSITNGASHILSVFRSLVHIFIGYPLKEVNTNAFEIKHQLQKERMKSLLEEPLIDKELLRQGISGKTHLLYELQRDFELDWQKTENKEFEIYERASYEQGGMSIEAIRNQLIEKKHKGFLQFLEGKMEEYEEETQQLLRSFVSYYKSMIILKREISDFKKEARKKLFDDYNSSLLRRKIFERTKKTKIAAEEIIQQDNFISVELLERIIKKLESLPHQRALVQNYADFLCSYKEALRKSLVKIEKPYKVFDLKYKFYPPGDIIQSIDYKTNKIKYTLEKEKIVKISSLSWGWRTKYYFHMLFSNCNNIGIKIITLGIYGRLGIKRLFGIKVFYPNDCVYVNESDGTYQFIEGSEITTIFSLIISMFRHISLSRNKFLESEQSKNCLLNLLNIIWLYFLRVIIQGLFFYLIIMPVLIIVHFILCFVFLNLSLVFGLIYTAAYIFVNIFIFDYVVKPLEDMIDFSIKFPLPMEIANTVINGFLQILFSLSFLAISPVLFLLVIVASTCYYFFRMLLSGLIFPLIVCFCRKPTSKKRACFQEVGQNSPNSLKLLYWEDLLYIILVYIEKIERESQSKQIKSRIDENDSKIREILNSNYLSRTEKKLYQDQCEVVFQTCRQLKTSLSITLQEAIIPFLFTDLSLYRLYSRNSEELHVRIKKLSKCVEVFLTKKRSEFLWKLYPDLPSGDFELLTKKLIQSIFGIQIFEALPEEQEPSFQEFHKEPNFYHLLDTVVDHKMGNSWLLDHFENKKFSKKSIHASEFETIEFVDASEILQTTYEVLGKPLEHALLLEYVT